VSAVVGCTPDKKKAPAQDTQRPTRKETYTTPPQVWYKAFTSYDGIVFFASFSVLHLKYNMKTPNSQITTATFCSLFFRPIKRIPTMFGCQYSRPCIRFFQSRFTSVLRSSRDPSPVFLWHRLSSSRMPDACSATTFRRTGCFASFLFPARLRESSCHKYEANR
jgi:hypothetical protein